MQGRGYVRAVCMGEGHEVFHRFVHDLALWWPMVLPELTDVPPTHASLDPVLEGVFEVHTYDQQLVLHARLSELVPDEQLALEFVPVPAGIPITGTVRVRFSALSFGVSIELAYDHELGQETVGVQSHLWTEALKAFATFCEQPTEQRVPPVSAFND